MVVENLIFNIKRQGDIGASSTKGISDSLKKVEKSSKSATSGLSNFINSLKRIAFYRFIRSIVKGITEAFSEGLEKAYIFSSQIDTEGSRFAAALDRMKSAGNQAKGQLGSAFIALYAAAEPVLTALINLVTKVADAIAQLLSAFTGKTYLKANATAAKFADTMKRGAGSAKEWKNQLLGFDEINRLNEPSSGGGGSSATDPLAGFDFKDTAIDQFWLDLVNNPLKGIKTAFEKVSEWFQGKDWQGVGKKAWEKVRGWFKDDGEASGVVSAFFETLGSAFGAVLGTAWGFLKESANETFRRFKQNIIDYDGDDKITLVDILTAALKTRGESGSTAQWIIENVIKPFFAGLKEAFLNPESEEKLNNVGENLMKGIITGMKLFTDEEGNFTLKKLFEGIVLLAKLIFGIHSPSTVFEEIGRNIVDGLFGGFSASWNTFSSWVSNVFNNLILWCQNAHNWLQDVLTGISLVNSTPVINHSTGNHSGHSGTFASGGFPNAGELFIAREAGPEMVGTLNGQTAVANNDQIVEGIRSGVYDAVSAAMSNGNNNGTEFRLYLDSREIKYGLQKLDRAWG